MDNQKLKFILTLLTKPGAYQFTQQVIDTAFPEPMKTPMRLFIARGILDVLGLPESFPESHEELTARIEEAKRKLEEEPV